LRGPNRGLDNVRVERADLGWNGGLLPIQNHLIPSSIFPNFEDLPISNPNESLDYPDIRREQVTVVKDPNGSAENPTYNSVILTPPKVPLAATYAGRLVQSTP